jgi:predicted Fe-Mo cluster-binding NifX family protein
MKIAVPTRDGVIDDHFGHCAYYTIFDIENNEIVATSRLDSPEGCGCKSNIASVMQEMGIELMLAGNMGQGAKNKLESHNIQVIRGCKGNIEMVVRAYLIGLIKDSGEGCSHHECGSHE